MEPWPPSQPLLEIAEEDGQTEAPAACTVAAQAASSAKEELSAEPADTSDMLTLSFITIGGAGVELSFDRQASLRDMQRTLCKAWRKAFPTCSAALLTQTRAYSELTVHPLLDLKTGDEVTVHFDVQTSDPYLFDQAARDPLARLSLKEEGRFDEESASGQTTLSLRDWLVHRRTRGLL